jgi:hypothetical protein
LLRGGRAVCPERRNTVPSNLVRPELGLGRSVRYRRAMRGASFLVHVTLLVVAGCSGSGKASGAGPSPDGGGQGAGDDATVGVMDDGGVVGAVQDGSSSDGATVAPPGADAGARPDSGAGSDGGSGVATVGGIFTAPEPWTLDVSALTKSSRSDAIIAALDAAGGWGGGALQIDFSIPLFFGNTSTPRQTITAPSGSSYCYGGPDCDPVPLQMPLPANGNTEGSTTYVCDTSYKTDGQGDCHVLVVETDQQKLYELYNATKAGSAFTALGAFIWDLTKAYPDNLRGDQCTSADAAGFPIAALLPTADEVAAGAINHAIRFILPNGSMESMAYVHPATHAGSPSSTDPNAPPYGVRFRLNASFDETPYGAGAKVVLQAMKKFGMLLSDGGTIALTFADDRTTTAKWASQGIDSHSFSAIGVDSFEVVDLGPEIALTDDCVRNP